MLPFQTVVCAVDLSPNSAHALTAAAGLAERAQAALHIVHVAPPYQVALEAEGPEPFAAQRFVDATLGADAARRSQVHVVAGLSPAAGILRTTESLGGNVVVVGTHGRRGLEHVLLGSVAADVLRQSGRPVLVVPEHAGSLGAGPVLVAADVSVHDADGDRERLRLARAWADAHGAAVVLGHVRAVSPDTLIGGGHRLDSRGHAPTDGLSRDAAHAALGRLVADVDADAPVAPEQYVMPGVPGPDLVALADRVRASVVVMGTHGRRGLARLRLGSVAEWVVRHAPCAVLVVPLHAADGDA